MDTFYAIISMTFVLGIVMAMAYITTRYVGAYSIKRFNNSNMKLIEVMPIGNQKFIYIVKVVDKHMVLAVTKDDIRLLDTVDGGKILERKDEGLIGKDFRSIFDAMTKRQKK